MKPKRYSIYCYKDDILIDPGKGYRLLEVFEIPQAGDEVFKGDRWIPISKSEISDFRQLEVDDSPFRRFTGITNLWDQETDKILFMDPVTKLKYEVFTRTYKDIKSANEDQYQMLQVGWFGLAHPSVECIVTYKRRA